MKEKNFKLIHIYYTIIGYTLFVSIFLIQFLIFTPISAIFVILGIDKKRLVFTYVTKFSCNLFFSLFFLFGHRLRINKEDFKNIDKNANNIYLINHSSIYDVILSYLLPGAIKFVIKDKWAKMPFIGWMQSVSGNIVVGQEDPSEVITENEKLSINESSEIFKNKLPIVIFPEGTRSKDGEIQKFKRGAFRIAFENQADIVPIVMDTWNCVRPSGILIRDIKPVIKVLKPIKYEQYKGLTLVELSKNVRYLMTKELYEIRQARKTKEKKYYRNFQPFIDIDNKTKQSLEDLKKELEEKGKFLF